MSLPGNPGLAALGSVIEGIDPNYASDHVTRGSLTALPYGNGAFELAATVDYLFGFDATAGVVHDWMYESLAKEYVLDEDNQAFMKKSNPWALRGIVERLGEAAERGLWAEPDPEIVAAMQQVYLDIEGDLEDR